MAGDTIIPSSSDVFTAYDCLKKHARHTALRRSPMVDKVAGLKVWIKPECKQHTGSFKYRGAYNRLRQLSDREAQKGVVAFSSGNHAQGVARAAKELGISAIIVMPKDAPRIKVDGVLRDGGEIVFYDRLTESREEIAQIISRRDGRTVVPSFDDPRIIAGQGTAGVEIYNDLKSQGDFVDALITPLGGGGLCAGLSLATLALSPKTAIFGSEPAQYDDHFQSLQSGARTGLTHAPPTLCDALMTPKPGQITFAINQKSLQGVFRVTDEEALLAMALAYRFLDLTIEPGGAVALAAVLSGRFKRVTGAKSVCVMVSGGNVDPQILERALKLGRD